MLYAFLIAAVLVAIAEVGDKTQMLSLVLAARYGIVPVFAGVAAAILVLQLLATVVGSALGSLLPRSVLEIGAGVLFMGFGLWMLRGERSGSDSEPAAEESLKAGRSRFGPSLTAALTFFVAELGDKTQLLTMTIAADPGAAGRSLGRLGLPLAETGPGLGSVIGVWAGSTLGMLLVNGIAVVAGAALGTRLPERAVRIGSGIVFLAFGAATLAVALIG